MFAPWNDKDPSRNPGKDWKRKYWPRFFSSSSCRGFKAIRCRSLTSLPASTYGVRTVAPANWFAHFCIVTQSPCYGYEQWVYAHNMCVNQQHSNTGEIRVCELVWRHDFYSVYLRMYALVQSCNFGTDHATWFTGVIFEKAPIGAGSGGGGAGGRPPPPPPPNPKSGGGGAKRVFAPPPQIKKKGKEGKRKKYNI